MIVLIGKTCSGKDSVAKRLISAHGYKKITTFTSRPMRKGEVQNVTYHYITTDEFIEKINKGFFAEWKCYATTEGLWYYGTAIEDLERADDNTVIILTPDGYRDVIKKLGNKVFAIYIYADNETIKKRLISRGDDEQEAKRRLKHDNIDFKGIEYEVDIIVQNNDGTNIDDLALEILKNV